MTDKTIKVSYDKWKMLKTAAAERGIFTQNLLDDILEGKIDPKTLA